MNTVICNKLSATFVYNLHAKFACTVLIYLFL